MERNQAHKRPRSESPDQHDASSLPKRRQRAQYFADPSDHTAESMQQGLKVVEMDHARAMKVGHQALDLMLAGSVAAVQFRQTGLRTYLAKALSTWVKNHRRTGAELLDTTRNDAPGRVVRKGLRMPMHAANGVAAWQYKGTPLERVTEELYTREDEIEEDERDHRLAIEELATSWVTLLKTARNVQFYASSEEKLVQHMRLCRPAALEESFVRMGELALTQHLVYLTSLSVITELTATDGRLGTPQEWGRPLSVPRAPLLWLGQSLTEADRVTETVASPAAALQAHRARRGEQSGTF